MKRSINGALRPLHLAVAMAVGTVPSLSYAAPAPQVVAAHKTYAVPAGPVEKMLLSIARESGRVISFDPATVAGYQGQAVNGNLTVEQAVAQSLRGTGLALDVTANGTLTVTRSAPVQTVAAPSEDAQLPEIAVTGAALSDDQLYYNPSFSSVVTRSDLALKETPQSVEVMSAKLIKDRQATSLSDVLHNSAGVVQTIDSRGSPTYKIRGFAVQQTSTNGIPNAGVSSTPIQGIERVEVVKGPDSIMSGSSSPGGTINIVRKAPVTEDLRTLTGEVADNGEFKQGVDLGGALNSDKSLSYRLNMSNMKSDSAEPDFDGEREVFVAPALRWEQGGKHLTVGAEYSNSRNAAPRSTVALNGDIVHLPSSRLFRSDDRFASESKTGYYEFKQELADGWSFNSKASYEDRVDKLRIWQLFGLAPNGAVSYASPSSVNISTRTWGTQNDFRGKIKTGFVTQNLLLGMDYQHVMTNQDERYVSGEARGYPNVNIYDPGSLDNLPKVGGPNYRPYESRLQQRGLIIQDQIDLGERTHVMLAGKKAKWISDSASYSTRGRLLNASSFVAEKWVPNYGISFDITPQVTAYANLLHGFTGTGAINTLTREQIPPTTSESKEVGLKFNLLDDNLTLTAAYFELQQDNVPVTEPNTANVIGTQSKISKGYDLNLSGEIVPGWNVTGSYTHSKFEEPDLSDAALSVFNGQPENAASLWTSYQLQEGKFKGFGAGVGVDAFSSVKGGTSALPYTVPGGAITDVSLFYNAKEYSITLGMKNVFDRELYYGSSSSTFVPMLDQRSTRLSFTYNF